MHELSIAQDIVEICERNATGRRVLTVDVEVGMLSSIVPDALEFCFAAVCSGTLLDGAQLRIHTIPGAGLCTDCSRETVLPALFAPCEQCGGNNIRLLRGEEMRVREIEVED